MSWSDSICPGTPSLTFLDINENSISTNSDVNFITKTNDYEITMSPIHDYNIGQGNYAKNFIVVHTQTVYDDNM